MTKLYHNRIIPNYSEVSIPELLDYHISLIVMKFWNLVAIQEELKI